MTQPDATNQRDTDSNRSQSNPLRIILLLIPVLLIGGLVVWFALPNPNGKSNGVGSETQQQLELTRTALAATENLEVSEADGAWTELSTNSPQDASIALNLAINRVLRVDQLSATAQNASLDAEKRKAARMQLPNAITAAREAIAAYDKLADDPVVALWLAARVDLHEAALLPGSMTKSLRKKVYQRLSEAIRGELGKQPNAIILGGTLIQVVDLLEDPLDGLPDDIAMDASSTIGALSDQHPDNLFFALRAARLHIENRDAKAVTYVRRAQELAAAIEPLLRRETQPLGITPDALVDQIVQAIETGDWPEASHRMLLWFNVLNSTEIVKTDRRRASPHPLDLLSFDSLRRLSAQIVQSEPLPPGDADVVLNLQSIADADQIVAATTIDFDLDLDLDLIAVDDRGLIRLWINDGQSNWQSGGSFQLSVTPTELIPADLFMVDSSDPKRLRADPPEESDQAQPDYGASVRHDAFQSLIAVGPQGAQLIQLDGRAGTAEPSRISLVEGETGLEDVQQVTAAVVGDLEADGDLDLVLATQDQGVRFFVNRGNRSFFEIKTWSNGFDDQDPIVDLAIADLDRDLDLDIVSVHGTSGRVGLIENLLHLQFRGRYLDQIDPISGASSVAVEEIDGNVSWDLVIAGTGGATIAFSQTAGAGAWTVDKTVVSDQRCEHAVVADLDNDSWMDILAVDSQGMHWCPMGPWGFGQWKSIEGIASLQPVSVGHLDDNVSIDVAGLMGHKLCVLSNETDPIGHHIDVRFRGIDDNVSGRVNHYAIGSVMELRFGPHYRARIVTSPTTHFGTDGFDQAGSIRAILPNGLTQTIRDPRIDSLVEEEQTLKGSCPYLYAWDGEKFVFQTDCLWAAPLGLQVADGIVAKDRPWEYLKIDGTHIRPRGDRYEFRITEELWEVAYFDKVALTVVDHPEDVEIWTNEKVGPASIAEPRIFAFQSESWIPLTQAFDTRGDDVTQQLTESDQDFVQAFQRRFRQGLCPPHWIDLTFQETSVRTHSKSDSSRMVLVLTGWIMPTDTSLNIQIDQNPDLPAIEFPSLWIPDSAAPGKWKKVIDYIGFPGGKTKTIVVDVTDVIDMDDPRMRIRTSAQIYWDRARLASVDPSESFRSHSVELLHAEVGFHGFSKRLRKDPKHPETYDYQQADAAARWPPLRGRLTQFGDCTDLLGQWDDKMVVISSGDEIRLTFALPESELPLGWRRDFVLHSVGWDKDADLNTLAGQTIDPLPYRAMTEYPPPLSQGQQTRTRDELNRFHRQRTQSFRAFWHRGATPPRSRFFDGDLTVE